MAFYLLKSKPKNNIANLHYDMDDGLIHTLIPFEKFYLSGNCYPRYSR